MSEKLRKYVGVLQCNPLCAKRDVVLADVEAGNKIGKSVIGREKMGAQFPVYLDTEDKPNIYAVVKELKDEDGNVLTDDEIIDLANQEYILTPTGVDGKKILCEIVITKEKSTFFAADGTIPADIQELMDQKVAEGIVDKEGAEERVKVMLANYVSKKIIKRSIRKFWKKYDKPAHKLRCLFIDPYLESHKKKGELGLIAQELSNAVDGYAMIMEGEKSVGKNVFVETIAWLLCMPLYLLTFSRNMNPSAVYGEKSTDNSASEFFKTPEALEAAKAEERIKDIEATITTVKRSFLDTVMETPEFKKNYEEYVTECAKTLQFAKLISADGGKIEVATKMLGENSVYSVTIEGLMKEKEALREKIAELKVKSAQAQSVNICIDASELYDWLVGGGLMVFNEMNMAESNFFASFTNQLLDGTGFLFIPGRGEVKIDDYCVLCGTQNADYEGVEQQNEATISRFGCLHFEQPESIKAQLKEAVNRELKKHGEEDADIKADIFNQIEQFYKLARASVMDGDLSNAVLNIRGFVRAITQFAENDGDMSLKSAVEAHVINTCPVDERKTLIQTASTVFGTL